MERQRASSTGSQAPATKDEPRREHAQEEHHETPAEHLREIATGHDHPMEEYEPAAPFWLVWGTYLIVLAIAAVVGVVIWAVFF